MRIIPLLGTQLGIWLADQVAARKNAYVIAHAVELNGAIDAARLSRAIRDGLAEADTVTARFAERDGRIVQILGGDAVAEPERIDLAGVPDPEGAARAVMADDLAGDLPADGERPLCRQILFDVTGADGAPRWIWYQRYHHIMLDGYSFNSTGSMASFSAISSMATSSAIIPEASPGARMALPSGRSSVAMRLPISRFAPA